MRRHSALWLTLWSFLALLSGGVAGHGQQQRQAPAPRQEIRNPLAEFFNIFRPKPPEAQPSSRQPRPPAASIRRPSGAQQAAAPRRRAPAPISQPVVVSDAPAAPTGETTVFIAVIGDSLAEMLAGGLSEAFSENDAVDIVRKTKSASGLVRDDFFDWRKGVAELLGSGDAITHAVVMIGSNDRQPLRDGSGALLEPLTDEWKAAYGARIDEIVKAFADRSIPLIWVGMPIMQSARYSEDMLALNEIAQSRVKRAGGIFVDIYEAFGDDQGRYVASGPSVTGETVRLRSGDGVHFTKAGARKAAHFVEVELNRLLDQRQPAIVIALPPSDPASQDPALRPGGIERLIDEAARAGRDDPEELRLIPVKPLAGPIFALTQPESSEGGRLLGDAPPARINARALVQDRAAESKPGRGDDFRWPVN